MKPLVTVILPIYNCELFVKDAIQSILDQTYTHFEFLILDDCSTDNTFTIASSFDDARIRIIQKVQNSGYTNSLNLGIQEAKGVYIARMDGDDISLPERLEKQVNFMQDHPEVAVCGCSYQIVDSEQIIAKPVSNEAIKIAMLQESAIGHPTAMIRTSILHENNLFYDPNFEPAEDYDLWVRLLAYGKLANLDEVLFSYRNHDGQVSETRKNKQRTLATASRWNLLKYLQIVTSTEEELVYKKLFSLTEKFNFEEIETFLNFKRRLLVTNATIQFFQIQEFRNFLFSMESRVINQFFLANKTYSPKIIYYYFKLINTLEYKLPFRLLIKTFLKSVVFYKIPKK